MVSMGKVNKSWFKRLTNYLHIYIVIINETKNILPVLLAVIRLPALLKLNNIFNSNENIFIHKNACLFSKSVTTNFEFKRNRIRSKTVSA